MCVCVCVCVCVECVWQYYTVRGVCAYKMTCSICLVTSVRGVCVAVLYCAWCVRLWNDVQHMPCHYCVWSVCGSTICVECCLLLLYGRHCVWSVRGANFCVSGYHLVSFATYTLNAFTFHKTYCAWSV